MPTDEEIETFISLTFGGMLADGVDSGDINSAISDFKEFISPYVNQSIPCTSNVQNKTERTCETVQCP